MPFPTIADMTPEERAALLDALVRRLGPVPRYTVAPNGWITYHWDPRDLDCEIECAGFRGASPIGR